jgi:purine-binding chemotaxis protein CheW
MRPMPLRPIQGTPQCVSGVSVIRGEAIPVVDLRILLGDHRQATPDRLVTLRVGSRHLALAVEGVLGIRQVPDSVFSALPPLLRSSDTQWVDALGALDSELLVLLQAGRILPDELWEGMSLEEPPPCR